MSAPLVTVLIPCYNQGHFLQECLASLRAQTVADWQALVVDDCSTDGATPGLCDQHASEQVQVLHLPHNHGRATARQVAVQQARGTYVMRLDADDCLAPDYLQKTLPHFDDGPKIGFVYTDYRHFGTRTGIMRFERYDEATLYRRQVAPNGALVRREAWLGSRGHRDEYNIGNEDYDFWMALAEAGWAGVHVPEPLYLYRNHAGSWTSQRVDDDRVFRSRLMLVEHHQAGFAKHGAAPQFLADTWLQEGIRRAEFGRHADAKAAFAKALEYRPGDWRARIGTWIGR
ncbi:MAG: glycosyltransferase family 2 protein [Deltaproteobacteria bacterium]|nr:glycosyltransferase family 2 protein [Deltaproteobacteria bacterium]